MTAPLPPPVRGPRARLAGLLAPVVLLACSPAADRPTPRPSTELSTLMARYPEANLDRGRAVYLRQCVSCHQADGGGTGRAIPPLVDHAPKLLAGPQGRAYLARLGLYGLSGKIEVAGRTYYNLMPAQGLGLADAEVAGALNYVLTQWGNDAALAPNQLLRPEDVARERITRRSAADNLAFRREAVPGVRTPPQG